MRRSILAVLAVCLTAAALPVIADAAKPPKPPGSPAPGTVGLTITAKPNPTVFQAPTVISGRLTGQNNGAKTVTLREDAFPFNSVDKVVNTVTAANGDYSFTRSPAKNTVYQVSFGSVRSANVLVNVRTRVGLSVSDRTPRVGQVIRFTGRACPTHIGLPVGLQRKGSTGFRTVRSTTLLASTSCSVYRRSIRVFSDGVFRVITKGHGDHARGISRTVFIDVHR